MCVFITLFASLVPVHHHVDSLIKVITASHVASAEWKEGRTEVHGVMGIH